MGGLTEDTQRRQAWSKYTAAAARVQRAMAEVRASGASLDIGSPNQPVPAWTERQWAAMKSAATAWYQVVEARIELERTYGP